VSVLLVAGVLLIEIAVILLHLPLLSPSPAILVLRSNFPLCGVFGFHALVIGISHTLVINSIRVPSATPHFINHVAFISPAIIVEVAHDYHPPQAFIGSLVL